MGGCSSQQGSALVQSAPQQNEANQVDLSHFEILRVVGRGGFGKVCAARRNGSNEVVAVKRLEKFALLQSDAYLRAAWRERQVLPLISGQPFLCPLYHAFHTESELFLVMPFYSGGDLRFHMKKDGMPQVMPEETAKFYAAQMLLGLEQLHKRNIIFRDLKPDNLLLDEDGNLVITDFGLAFVLSENNNFHAYSNAGTSGYKGPEVLQCLEYDYTADFWSFGVCLYELMHGYLPYTRKGQWLHTVAITAQVDPSNCDKTGRPLDNCPEKCVEPANTQCEAGADEVHISKRLSAEAKSLLRSLLVLQRAHRLGSGLGNHGVDAIKSHPFFRGVDWTKMSRKEIPAPFVPDMRNLNCSPDLDNEAANDPAPRVLPADKQGYFSGWSYNTILNPQLKNRRLSTVDSALSIHMADVDGIRSGSHSRDSTQVVHDPAHLPTSRPVTPTEFVSTNSQNSAWKTPTGRPAPLNMNAIQVHAKKENAMLIVDTTPLTGVTPKVAEEANLASDQISINGHAPFKKCTSMTHTLKLYPSLAGITSEVANLLGITYIPCEADAASINVMSTDIHLPEISQAPNRTRANSVPRKSITADS